MLARQSVADVATGIAGGLIAALAMTQFQSGWMALRRKRQPSSGTPAGGDEPSTVKAADQLTQLATGRAVPKPYRSVAGELVHYGFGGLLGGVYALAGKNVSRVRAGFGLPLGAVVWATADELLVPAAALSASPQRTSLATHAYGLISHLVFGAALEGSVRALQRMTRPYSQPASYRPGHLGQSPRGPPRNVFG